MATQFNEDGFDDLLPSPNIPKGMDVKNWLVYRLEPGNNGKKTKPSYDFRTGRKANNPALGVSYAEAKAASKDYDGVGFYLEPPFIGLDFDGCVDPDGLVSEEVVEIIREYPQIYWEWSISGTGIHGIAKGTKPGDACRRGNLEIYQTGRYFTFSGRQIPGTSNEIQEVDITPIYKKMVDRDFEKPGKTPLPSTSAPEKSAHAPRNELIHHHGRLTTRLVLLMTGEFVQNSTPFTVADEGENNSVTYDSQSEAIAALLGCLAEKHSGNPEKMEAEFLSSTLYQGITKWNAPDDGKWKRLGKHEIAGAIKKYTESRPQQAPATPVTQTNPIADDTYPAPVHEDAFYGVAGEFVRTVLPQTESDPIALLGNFLVAAGLLFGRNAWGVADGKKHYAVEYLLMVGDSSTGRKGTATNRVLPMMSEVQMFYHDHILSGLSTGEGLIKGIQPKGKKVDVNALHIYLGLIQEFASLLQVMKREGNTMSAILREAFDGGRLRVMTKKDPLQVNNVNLGLIAHITPEELLNSLTDTDRVNGFANRFLPICVDRSKLLPEGGEDVSFADVVLRLQSAVEKSLSRGRIQRDPAAKVLWAQHYPILTRKRTGLRGALLSRAETHVFRLSIIYALLDGSDAIRVEHLRAALAFWNYVEDSVGHIFRDASGDSAADRILAAMSEGPLTKKEISGVFGNNRKSDWIQAKVESLMARGLIVKTVKQTNNGERDAWGSKGK